MQSRRVWGVVGAVALAAAGRPAANEQGDALLAAAQRAIASEAKWTSLRALTAEVEYRRMLDGSDLSGDLELKLLLPNRFQRIEHAEMPGGRGSMAIASTLDGAEAWRAPLGGGAARGGRRGPGGGRGVGPDSGPPVGGGADAGADAAGGPGGPRRGPRPGGPADPATVLRAVTDDYLRTLLGILPQSLPSHPLQFEASGVAESPDGRADVLKVTGADGFETLLFLDQSSHLPLMMTFTAPDPRRALDGRRAGGGGARGGNPPDGGGDPEERRRRFEEMRQRRQAQGPPSPPPVVSQTVYFEAHKRVDGLMLPHTIRRAVDGQVFEEWTVKRYRVNPSLEAKDFARPSRP